jgi:hypothetical protein
MKNYFVFFLFALLFGCKPAEKVVEAMTSQILEPVSLKFEGDLGEIAVGDAPIPLTMTITNNSSEPITDMKLDIGTFLSVFNYTPDSSGSNIAPGYGGNCGEKLESKESCTYTFLFNPRKTGLYNIPITFTYKNLIQAETKTTALNVLTGEPATLVFTNDISKYDFGVLEQTETTEREVELEIKNVGGLSARDIIYPLSNGDPTQPSFRIISNECTKVLKPSLSCKIKIGYKSFNNNYSDPEVKYSSKLAMSYRKDNSGKIDKLNAFFNFTSSTIEAKFATNYKTIDFGQVVAGNNVKRSIKVSNNGYNIGTLKRINFHKFDGSLYASCVQGTTQVLNCGQSLVDFPFLIEDKSNCFAKDVKGIIGSAQGESCYFDITYWPSKSYAPGSQALHDFDQATLAFVYDSHWLNKEKLVTKAGLFDITATFSSAGKMQLDSITIENAYLPAGKITTADTLVYNADLGRLAKISDPSLTTFMKITLKNVGESPVSLVSLQDGATTPHLITENGYDLNSYYKGIKHNSCSYLAPGATCNFSFNLSPVVQGSPAQEDALMYDNTADALRKYKQFSYIYDSGSTLEDNGSAAQNSQLEIRLISKLIAKGMLAFSDSLSQSIPNIISGTTYTKIINLKNVGTGDIYALSHHATNNLFPGSTQNGYPYRIVAVGTPPLPATKDCKDLLYGIGLPNPASDSPNSAKFLAPGQTCALAVEVAAANTSRRMSGEYTAYFQHERFFGQGLNGTADLWPRKQYSAANVTLTFNYYDGDANPDDASSQPFGYLNKTKDMLITSSFYSPPYIVVYDPTPVASGILVRPALNYPIVSQTYPTNNMLSAYNIAEAYFNATYFNAGVSTIFHSSASTDLHVKNMGIVGNTMVFHMGTFRVGTTNYADFKFGNVGNTNASNATITEETSAGNPISLHSFNNLTAKPFPAINISYGQKVPVRLKFTPTAAGTFSRCYDLSYDNRIGGMWVQTVCAYAEAIATSPLLKVQYQDIDVVYDSTTGTVTQTPTGVWTDVNSPVNVPMNSPLFGPDTSSKIAFTSVKGSAAYALKLIRITNIGTASATKMNYTFASTPNVPYALPSEISTSNATGANPTCSTNMTLAVNVACEFYIKYKPLSTSTSLLSPYLGLAYDMGPNLGQFASQLTTLQFNAVDPAKLVVSIAGVSSESVTDWSNAAIPMPQSLSWPLNLNNYSASNTHLITTTIPSTRVITNIPIVNSSSLKASFLSMNSNPGAGTWNTIFSNSNVTIEANRACFYGDDEFNGAIPSTDKGFNSTSTNKCYLQVTFSGDYTYQNCSAYNAAVKTKTVILGGRIQASCNPYVYTLNFYNYKRLSTEKIYLHMKGFIEPNRTTADATKFTNVSATSVSGSTGSATFTWPSMTPQNAAYGSITKYRIYYSTNYADLRTDNMFYTFTATPILSSFDTTNATIKTATINNLTQGKYYFFRVVPIRTYNHPIHGVINYVSMTPNLEILTLPIPNLTATYDHTNKVLIDKSVLTGTGSQTAGVSACAAKKYDLSILGVAKSPPKSLINSTIFSLIRDNPALSSGYPSNDVGTIPHWLSDAAYNLRTSINLYNGTTLAGFPNFDTTKLTGNNITNKAIYSKSCNNSSTCDLLYKVVGGDDVDLYYKGTYFTTPTGISAYHRCYAVILCPTNTLKPITDATCAAP